MLGRKCVIAGMQQPIVVGKNELLATTTKTKKGKSSSGRATTRRVATTYKRT